jgi:hypothetical protein
MPSILPALAQGAATILAPFTGFEQHDLAELRGRLIAITERWLDACLAAHTRELNAA